MCKREDLRACTYKKMWNSKKISNIFTIKSVALNWNLLHQLKD